MKRIIVLTLISVLILACSKEKSKKWIVFDLDVVNEISGESAPATFFLSYYTNGGIGEDHKTIVEIGSASQGEFVKTINVPRSSYKHELLYRSSLNAIPNFYNNEIYSGSRSVSKSVINKFDIEIEPKFYYEINTVNLECFDETDSLWLTENDYNIDDVRDDLTFVGCENGYYGVSWRDDSVFTFNYVVKKNGVITEHEITEIISWNTTEIIIEY